MGSGRLTCCAVTDADCSRPAARHGAPRYGVSERRRVALSLLEYPQREADACRSDRISRGSFSNYR